MKTGLAGRRILDAGDVAIIVRRHDGGVGVPRMTVVVLEEPDVGALVVPVHRGERLLASRLPGFGTGDGPRGIPQGVLRLNSS